MDINTFFKNGDVSNPQLNADGAFRLRPNNAFVDETYFEAIGIAKGLDARGTQAYKDVFSGWKKSYENDCAQISQYYQKAKTKLEDAKLKSQQNSGEARVARTYIVGFQKALDELQSLMMTKNCDIIGKDWTKGKELIESDSKGIGTFGTIAIIGGGAIVLGILGYYLYKKYAK